MEGALGQHRAVPTGLVRVGLPVVAANLLVPRLPELLERHPGLNVELVIRDSFGDLIEEPLDVALIGTTPPDSSVIARVDATSSPASFAPFSRTTWRAPPTGPGTAGTVRSTCMRCCRCPTPIRRSARSIRLPWPSSPRAGALPTGCVS